MSVALILKINSIIKILKKIKMDEAADKINEGSITSGDNVSFWIDTTSILAFDKPSQNISTEVLIIGGGIAGLTTAYKLLKARKK